ncbi:hypothetical protein HN446_04705 [bacterium]|nr:hypothetical protein [bacterium]
MNIVKSFFIFFLCLFFARACCSSMAAETHKSVGYYAAFFKDWHDYRSITFVPMSVLDNLEQERKLRREITTDLSRARSLIKLAVARAEAYALSQDLLDGQFGVGCTEEVKNFVGCVGRRLKLFVFWVPIEY